MSTVTMTITTTITMTVTLVMVARAFCSRLVAISSVFSNRCIVADVCCDSYSERSVHDLMAIEIQCLAGGLTTVERDECKATALLECTIFRNAYFQDLATIFEKETKVVFIEGVGEVVDVNHIFSGHTDCRFESVDIDIFVIFQVNQLVHLLL